MLKPIVNAYPKNLKVFNARPEIFSHNVECVERISKLVRTQANWQRSLDVLSYSVSNNLRTKTGIMVGLGERFDEVIDTMRQVSDLGVKLFTIGQYLQPSQAHLPVDRYVEDQEFDDYKSIGIDKVFDIDEDLVSQTEWFDDEIIGTKHGDFFVKRSINYSKRTQSITSDDLF